MVLYPTQVNLTSPLFKTRTTQYTDTQADRLDRKTDKTLYPDSIGITALY